MTGQNPKALKLAEQAMLLLVEKALVDAQHRAGLIDDIQHEAKARVLEAQIDVTLGQDVK